MAIPPRLVVFAMVVSTVAFSSSAVADDLVSPPEEQQDTAVPGTWPTDSRPVAFESTEFLTTLAAVATGPVIEDFMYDTLKTEGRASEVCAGRLLTGTGWAFWEVIDQFGGTAGTMYACRERWDAANDPDCNGTVSIPSSSFRSTCWSNHAAGRAFDVMVGRLGSGYNRSRGLAIVTWLIAKDVYGNVNANARRLGVQQILFDDRCWNSDGDRGIANWNAMRECGIGHHDHVHVDMTLDGANGAVSYWGATPRPPAPKPDTQVLWDLHSFWRHAISWRNLVATSEEGISLPQGFDRAVVGDWDSNGEQGEIFLWDRDTGDYFVQEWTDGDSLNARMGRLTADLAIAGDWDNDGEVDDMFFWLRTGYWTVWTWNGFEPTFRTRGRWSSGIDDITAGDFDGDGRLDDMHVWDNNTGAWNVFTWQSFRPTYRRRGDFPARYDDLIVGDWSAGGELDESILWDRQAGSWALLKWTNFLPKNLLYGHWGTATDVAAVGDFDTDGRADDIFLYDIPLGTWTIQSFHRYRPSNRASGDWASGYDVISVGPFNEQ